MFLMALLNLPGGNGLYGQIPEVWKDFVEARENNTQSILPDYSYSGYYFSEKELPDISGYTYFNVTDYGAIAGDTIYDDTGIQAAIDAAAELGSPAVVFFPAGKYMVSSDNDVNKSIYINGDNIVLKGEGSGKDGTEIFMDKMRVSNRHWQFRFQPDEFNTGYLTELVGEAKRGDFTVTVASAAKLFEGQSIFIHHKSEEFARAHYGNLELNETEWTRLFGEDGGMILYECHIIDSINGNVLTFKNPIQVDLPVLSEKYSIRNLKTIEGIGIEDILFTSGWGAYPEEFVHHANDTVDYAWNAIQFKYVRNSWIRNCEFKDWTQVADFRESIGITVDNVLISGKRGHSSWITRRNYGVLVKDCMDEANHHHGPGVGYSGVSTVYLRYKMSENQAIDCHSGSPITTLMDDIDGGDFHTNGGPWESYPHHGRYLTFWNFVHKKSSSTSYNFWSVDVRKPATYAEPFFVGFQPTHTVNMQGVALDEMRGIEVEPRSLFEAQLALRLDQPDTTPTFIEKDELRTDNIKISPNPFTTELLVNVNENSKIESIEMYGMNGERIDVDYSLRADGFQLMPDKSLVKGVYFVRIKTVNRILNYKIIKA